MTYTYFYTNNPSPNEHLMLPILASSLWCHQPGPQQKRLVGTGRIGFGVSAVYLTPLTSFFQTLAVDQPPRLNGIQ